MRRRRLNGVRMWHRLLGPVARECGIFARPTGTCLSPEGTTVEEGRRDEVGLEISLIVYVCIDPCAL